MVDRSASVGFQSISDSLSIHVLEKCGFVYVRSEPRLTRNRYTIRYGDWVEHTIELEAITDAKPGIKYPRIAEQNKPRFKRCEACAGKGKKEKATAMCIECSNEQQREVLLCEQCLMAEHEAHYSEEIVY